MQQEIILRENISKANSFILHMGVIQNKNLVTIDRKNGVILEDGNDITQKLKNMWENTVHNPNVLNIEKIPCGVLVYALLLNQLDITHIDKWLTNGTIVNIGTNNHTREKILSIGMYPYIDKLALTDKNKEIIKSFIYGESLKSIGQRYGIGGERVRQIIVMGKSYFVNKRFDKRLN